MVAVLVGQMGTHSDLFVLPAPRSMLSETALGKAIQSDALVISKESARPGLEQEREAPGSASGARPTRQPGPRRASCSSAGRPRGGTFSPRLRRALPGGCGPAAAAPGDSRAPPGAGEGSGGGALRGGQRTCCGAALPAASLDRNHPGAREWTGSPPGRRTRGRDKKCRETVPVTSVRGGRARLGGREETSAGPRPTAPAPPRPPEPCRAVPPSAPRTATSAAGQR